jgi:hypothetical protein
MKMVFQNLPRVAGITYVLALAVWQVLFWNNPILQPILWEIHTIFTSVLLFFVFLNYTLSPNLFDIIKIVFRILIKVWFVIFIAFSMHKNLFDVKGFALTATFVFGYLEGYIDLNSWLNNPNTVFVFDFFAVDNTIKSRLTLCVLGISWIHIFSACIAFIYFTIK